MGDRLNAGTEDAEKTINRVSAAVIAVGYIMHRPECPFPQISDPLAYLDNKVSMPSFYNLRMILRE